MKVMLDSNIFISAFLFPDGTASHAFRKAMQSFHVVVSDYIIDELYEVVRRKFPSKEKALDGFLSLALSLFEVVKTPEAEEETEFKIRDVDDRPVLRAALYADVDVIVTGDKDFLESALTKPRIMSPSEFLRISDGE